jgi:hypothetical protein
MQGDRLCWVKLQDMESYTSQLEDRELGTPEPPNLGTVFPSAKQGIQDPDILSLDTLMSTLMSKSASPTDALVSDSRNKFFFSYIPLDRLPVRSTPRGYVPGTAVTRVSGTQVLAHEIIGTSFSVTAGSHTHFFAASSAEEADAWVLAIKEAWHHCTMHAQRTVGVGGQDVIEHLMMAQEKRLQMEKMLLLQQACNREQAQQKRLMELVKENTGLRAAANAACMYEVKTVTSDSPGANTNSRIYVQLRGQEDPKRGEYLRSADQQLVYPPYAKKLPFARGAEDTFFIRACDLGDVVAVHLMNDASGTSCDWHVKSVHVRRKVEHADSTMSFTPWTDFPADIWLSESKGERDLEVVLHAGQLPRGKSRYEFDSAQNRSHLPLHLTSILIERMAQEDCIN